MPRTRREFLGSVGVAGALGVGLGPPAVRAQSEPTFDPENVTLDFDHEWLQRYRPAFVADYHTMQRSVGLFGYRATADEYEYDVACYWHRLSHQDGLPLTGGDAHLYDHEPCYVFVTDSGGVESVVYTHYHHFSDTLSGSERANALVSNETGDATHAPLEIVDPWHHYTVRPDATEDELSWTDVEDTGDLSFLDTWRTRDVFASTADEAVYDPATMRDRSSWWDESTLDYRFASIWHTLGQYIDVGGSEDAL